MNYFRSFAVGLFLICIACAKTPPSFDTISSQIQRIVLPLEDKSFLYINDEQSDELFYSVLSPTELIKGTLVLLPPAGQAVEQVIEENTELLQKASKENLLVVIPSINFNLVVDEVAIRFLNSVFDDLLTRFKVPEDKFVIGGFSLGGINAIRYTEYSQASPDTARIHPVAVFGVDPPLDLARLYGSFEHTIKKNFSEVAMQEARVYLQKMNARFGGSPEEQAAVYIQYSAYSKNAPQGGNSKYLKETPIRIYADLDTDWYLNERQVDLYDVNALDQTAMINKLNQMGNNNAEFINALGKGYRANGSRHPHSWSLIDPQDFIDWVLGCFEQIN
jgi:hypothetical protein